MSDKRPYMPVENLKLIQSFTVMAELLNAQGDNTGARHLYVRMLQVFNIAMIERLAGCDIKGDELLVYTDLHNLANGIALGVSSPDLVKVELDLVNNSPLYLDLVGLLKKHQEV